MKDLKHLIYFENLLQETKNELVDQAKADGKIIVGNLCNHVPEVLLNLPGTCAIRLRAPRTGSIQVGSYYLTSLVCEFCRAILERAMEGSYQFYDCLVTPFACGGMARLSENIDLLKCNTNEKFFVSYLETPLKGDDNGVNILVSEMKERVLKPLSTVYGVDVSDSAILKAVEEHNEMCKIFTELGEFRKEINPKITGYEFAVLCIASYCCPHYLIMDKLKETLEEVKLREKDSDSVFNKKYRARVALVGSEIDDPDFIKLIEDNGALVVADRFCYGSIPGREVIELNDKEDLLTQICRHYVNMSLCPRFMDTKKINERTEALNRIAKEYNAEGMIIEQMKFCDYWGYERAHQTHLQNERYDWPVLSVDRPYIVGTSGQMRTRVQAFVESIEIKRIQKKGANK